MKILLTSVNARYSHSSYAVRSLKANLRELEDLCAIQEVDLTINALQLASDIAENSPRIAGFSIYLWNLRVIETAARILKQIAPQIKLVAGGPELTIHYENADLFDLCIIGEGESALREYCRAELAQDALPDSREHSQPPTVIQALPENCEELTLPFHLYNNEDIANRLIYVEAARGCPYHCIYCTSAGTGLRLIPLSTLLPGLDDLWQRGVRQFKFLDRSFTAAKEHALAIMNFFLERCVPEMSLHFEVYTDILHPEIKAMITRFPAGALHLECGVQTLNPLVANRIGRSGNVDKTLSNLKFLTQETGADIHADLIFGLPGESETSFAAGFNRMVNSCNPQAVQINLLKALPGTELSAKAAYYQLKFNREPPYELLESDCMDFNTLTRIQRLARCRELIHNRGNFEDESRKLLELSPDVYTTFMQLSERIYQSEGRMYRIARAKLKTLINDFLIDNADNGRAPEIRMPRIKGPTQKMR